MKAGKLVIVRWLLLSVECILSYKTDAIIKIIGETFKYFKVKGFVFTDAHILKNIQ